MTMQTFFTRRAPWLRIMLVALLLLASTAAHAQLKLSNASVSAAADAVVDLVDAGAGPGTLVIFGSACPTNVDDADSGTVLAVLTFSDPAFGAASNGVATASAITQDSSADATGTAACFRVKDSNGVARFQGAVGTAGAQLNLVTTSIVATQPVQVTSFTYTQPKS
jgi:hypothetical protein